MHRNSSWRVRVFGLLLCLLPFSLEALAQEEKPASLESLDRGGALSLDLFGDEPSRKLSITGFGVGAYSYEFNSGHNSFEASALAVALSKVVSDHLAVFAQLTASRESDSPFFYDPRSGGDISTDIDNLQLTWVPSAKSGLQITFGKFDSPLGIERDDAPLNFQATNSFTFNYGRPVKLTGLQLHEAFSQNLELWGIVANGWDVDKDNNKGKTGALYGMWSPSLRAHVGLGVIYGPEKDDTTSDPRTTGVLTLLFQPTDRLVFGDEAVTGTEAHSAEDGGTARWYGNMFFAQYRFTDHWALTLRTDELDDQGGARTGRRQVLRSITLSPQYLLGGGFYGIFRYLDRTSLRLPEFQVRLDLRYDRSTEATFRSKEDDVGRRDRFGTTLQTVFLF